MPIFAGNVRMLVLTRTFIIIMWISLLSGTAFSQTTVTVRGLVFNKTSSVRLAQVTIANRRNQTYTSTNNLGEFIIQAAIGDSLMIFKAGFTEQKIAVMNSQDLMISLIQVTQLSDVIIKSTSKKQEMQETMDAYRSKGIYFNGKPPLLAGIASPATALYELFGKAPKQARHFSNYMKRENEQTAINKRYNKELVKRITGLSDEESQQLVEAYQPTPEEIAKWSDYDLIQFIKKSAVSFKSPSGLKPLPKLTPTNEAPES